MDIVPILEGSKDCKFCKVNTSQGGVVFHGSSHRYLEEGDEAHMECYIDYCVKMEHCAERRWYTATIIATIVVFIGLFITLWNLKWWQA